MGDPGDEDDGDTHPKRWMRNGWRFRYGKTLCLYPAERVPSEPDGDPGDEEPRVRISRRFGEALRFSDGI